MMTVDSLAYFMTETSASISSSVISGSSANNSRQAVSDASSVFWASLNRLLPKSQQPLLYSCSYDSTSNPSSV